MPHTGSLSPLESLTSDLAACLGEKKKGSYAIIMPYLPDDSEWRARISALKAVLIHRFKIPVMKGSGFRYPRLTSPFNEKHSWRLLLENFGKDAMDLPVVASSYGFSALTRTRLLGGYLDLNRMVFL
ncbi:MAG: hypothetical protein ACYCYP_06705 [Leptospirales bacterium]